MLTIEDYLERKGVEQAEGRYQKSDSLMYYCAIHTEHTPSFHVTPSTQLWHCHGCKRGGGIKLLVKLVEGFEHFYQAYDYLEIPRTPYEENTPVSEEKPKREPVVRAYTPPEAQVLFTCAARWWHTQLWSNTTQAGPARRYLLERGGALHVLHSPQIGYAPKGPSQAFCQMLARDSGLPNWRSLAVQYGLLMPNGDARMQGRVMFSSLTTQGSYLYFQGRVLPPWKSKYKYLGAKGCSKYPFSIIVSDPILKGTVGVESPIGAVVLASFAVGNLATLGNGTITKEILLHYPGPYYWAQDNDEPHPITRNNVVVGFTQPGEIQAQACMKVCQAEGLPNFRLLPPRTSNGLDEWIVAEQSVLPLLNALQYEEEEEELVVYV